LPGAPITDPAFEDAGIRLIFGGIPDGVTLGLEVLDVTGTGAPDATITDEVDQDDNEAVITWSGNFSDTPRTNRVEVLITVEVDADAELEAGDTITVRATMDPAGEALDEEEECGGTGEPQCVPIETEIPRFAEDLTDSLTVVSIVPATSTLLLPYATRITSIGYDTGIAISNTSADPFGDLGGADEQSGAIHFDFFPTGADGAGDSFEVDTDTDSITGDSGLSSDGELAAGGTYVTLMSSLLAAAGETDFTGYVFIQADFQFAHGVAFISDFSNFTSFTPILVLDSPAITGRGSEDPTESLGF
jgi:hypothetical protein